MLTESITKLIELCELSFLSFKGYVKSHPRQGEITTSLYGMLFLFSSEGTLKAISDTTQFFSIISMAPAKYISLRAQS